MHPYLVILWTTLKARWDVLRRQPEAGYTTESVVITAALVTLALAIAAILTPKVLALLHDIAQQL